MSAGHTLRLCRRSESGAVAIEFAIFGSILVLVTIGILELGRVLYTQQKVIDAVGAATRLVAMNAADSEIMASVESRFSSTEQGALTVDLVEQTINGARYRRINARYDLPLLLPNFHIFGGQSLPISSFQLVPLE